MVDLTKSSSPVRTLTPVPVPAPQLKLGASASAAAGKPGAKPAAPGKPGVKPGAKPSVKKKANFSTFPFWAGLSVSVAWVAVVVAVLAGTGGTHTFGGLPLINWAVGISAIVSPVALIWMVTAYLQRAADVQSVTDPLRRQLGMILGESGAAEIRVRRFNQAIREQLDLLKSTQNINNSDFMSILDRVNQHKNELEQFEQHSIYQVREIQDVIRRSMQHIEQLMEDKFTMLRVLDNKLVQSGDDVSRQTEAVHDQISTLLHDIESNAGMVADSLERAMTDSRKLSDMARAQETSLLSATAAASGTLQDLSGKIDTNIARFLERTGTAREEAERLAGAIDAQTRSLDEFSNLLPARVGEAEAVLRGVADRLYASEQLAREQAVQLSERLSTQVDSLQQVLDRFGIRFTEIDGQLTQKRTDFDGLVVRISGATNDLADQLDTTINRLGERTESSLKKLAATNEEARQSTDAVASTLAETAARYEAAIEKLGTVSEGNKAQLQAITAEVGSMLGQFEALHKASQQAGSEVQARAGVALQNLQHVLERLLATRDATQSVGETLTEKLRGAVDQNERVIVRINEAARMTVHALGIATESLGRQGESITGQSDAMSASLKATIEQIEAEANKAGMTLRTQNEGLTALLQDVRARLDMTEQKLQDFASKASAPIQDVLQKIDQGTIHGEETLSRYTGNMQNQLGRLQEFNAHVSSMGEDVGRMTTETLSAIEEMTSRFMSARTLQDETTRSTLDQFKTMADRLQSEIGTLGEGATQAVATLQQAAEQVSTQSRRMQDETALSGSKIQDVTSALQNEASEIRASLHTQAEALGSDLEKAEQKFAALSEALALRSQGATELLDKMVAHYNETAEAAAKDLEARAGKLSQTAEGATGKVDGLSAALSQQISLIDLGSAQIENHALQMGETSIQTIGKLDSLSQKIEGARASSVASSNDIVTKLDEAGQVFARHSDALADASLSAVGAVQKAGVAFGEQASKMLDTSYQIEQNVRTLSSATTAFADQASEIRTSMEQHNSRLIATLNESVGQLDTTSAKLQQSAATAILSADQAAVRFDEVTRKAGTQLGSASDDLFRIADKTEGTLGALSSGITQQIAALNIVGEQLETQYHTLSTASETQKAEVADLFAKIGAAHKEASDVAERTISRLGETLGAVNNQLSLLAERSDSALTNVGAASDGFATQTKLLIENARQAEAQANAILGVTSNLEGQARQLREALGQESARTAEILSSLLGKIASSSDDMKEVGSAAETVMGALQAGITDKTLALGSTMQEIGERQKTLTSALDQQKETMDALLARLSSAQDETAATAARGAKSLAESAQAIETQASAIEAKTASALSSVSEASLGFADKATALAKAATDAEDATKALFATTSALETNARELGAELRQESATTGQMLETLVSQIDAKTGALRDVSVKTEATLSNLGTTVTQQTNAMTGSMQMVTERQTSLTSAMDAQRETFNGMVTRLTLAQDEAAASAERNAMRLSESTQQISREMENLESKTQDTVAAVRAAGAGLADETAVLGQHTRKAEEQVGKIVSVTTEMKDQARQIKDTMQEEAGTLVEQVRVTMSQLDSTVSQLKQQSGNVVGVMDKSVADLSSLAKTTTDTLQRQSENLQAVASESETRIMGVGEKIRDHVKLVVEASNVTEEQARKVSTAAQEATGQLVALCTKMSDSDAAGHAALEKANGRLEEVRAALETELKNVADISEKASHLVMEAGLSLSTQSEALRANLSSSESALGEAATNLREEANQLPALLARSTTQIEETGKSFRSQTSAVTQEMLQTSDRCIAITGSLRDTMMDEARHLTTVADTASQTLASFNQALTEQLAAIQNGTTQLSSEQTELVEKASQTLTQLTAANDRLSQLRSDTLQTTSKLAQDFETIETRAENASSRLEKAGSTLSKEVAELAGMVDQAEGKMLGASQGFRDQLERVRGGVKTQIDDINRGLMQITAQLERTGGSLRSTMASTVVDVEKLSNKFDGASKETATQLTDRTARMRAATEEVAKLLSGFGDQIDVLMDRLSMAGDGIKRHESDFVGHMQQAFTHLGSVVERLESSRSLTKNISAEAMTELEEAAKGVEKQIKSLTENAQTVTGIVRGVGQAYTDQTQGLSRSVLDTQEQIITMNKSVEDMQMRTDRMRVALKLQGEDLLSTLEQILKQLSATGDSMGDAVDDVLQDQAANSLKRFNS